MNLLVVESRWFLEVDTSDERWKHVSPHNSQFYLPSRVGNEFIENENESWANDKVSEERVLYQSPHPVQHHQDVPDGVGVMGYPEAHVHMPACVLCREGVYDGELECQENGSQS